MALTEEEMRAIEQEERAKIQPKTSAGKSSQKHSVPAILSFFIPGLGQLVKGQVGRGILIFFGTALGLAMAVIPGIIVWIWQITDAYNK